ncbi:MAG: aminotransferase class I/II-fold pyridoxal phosphate-dependent enzyme [Thermoleophilia bacterium]
MQPFAKRVSAIAPFEVMEVLGLARELEHGGADVIHLEVGEPDFATPEPVREAARRAVSDEPMTYTSGIGLIELREAIARWYHDVFGVTVDVDRIVVTTGSSAALLLALGACVNSGDRVLMGDPAYPCNRNFARLFDAEPILVPTDAGSAYQLTADQIRVAATPDTSAVIVASPANPTGTLVADDAWDGLIAACDTVGATLIVDEIYQGLVYGRSPHTVLAHTDQVVVVNSFSKYFQMTGWRVGWLVVPPGWTRHIETLAQNLFICPPTPSQHAAVAALSPDCAPILDARRREFANRRDVLLRELPRTGLVVDAVPDGAFYVYADTRAIADDSFAMVRDLLSAQGVALTPGRDFGDHAPDTHVRIAYTQPVPRLLEAIQRIVRWRSETG